jgi:hypothetical protein
LVDCRILLIVVPRKPLIGGLAALTSWGLRHHERDGTGTVGTLVTSSLGTWQENGEALV